MAFSHMIVNEMKTKVMLFGNVKVDSVSFMYNDKKLAIVDQYKYLGILFNSIKTSRGNVFRDAVEQISLKATRACFKIRKDTKQIGKPPPNVLLRLFDSLIIPILEYGAEVYFNNKENQAIEKVQLKFLKMMLSVHSNTSSLAVYGDTGRHCLFIRHKLKAIKYWVRIVQMKDDSLVKIVYNMLCSLDDAGFTNWVTNIRKCLIESGSQHVWENQICDTANVKSIKVNMMNKFEEVWYDEINNGEKNPKLRTYCTFKLEFGMEPYLLHILDHKLIKTIAQFRMSCHCLAIEKGRHQKPKIPVEERKCLLCNGNNIEDEKHFLMHCPFYRPLRIIFLETRNEMSLVNNDFISVMNCEDSVFYLGKLLFSMFKKRKEHLCA